MLAATDPAAVIATMKRLRAPERLSTLIEAESVFNDGTAIVVFTVALAALTGGLSLVDAGITLVVTVVVSSVIGRRGRVRRGARHRPDSDDHLVELSITLVLAYGTYVLADAIHMSGIIATVVAAIIFGIYARRGAHERAREGSGRNGVGVRRVPADRAALRAHRPGHRRWRAGVPQSCRSRGGSSPSSARAR